ncbi:MAG: chain length determinant protein, partial [Candidatus Competibacteraceae bacterium]|nr:chain length determinant protein [Candidatus Competibacteraceae bacterium]
MPDSADMKDQTSPPTGLAIGPILPLASLKAHKWLAVLVTVAVTCAGVAIAWFKGTPVYQATAVVYVAPRFANILEESKELEFQSNSQYLQFVSQQARTINRYDIVLEALQKLGERRFVWQQGGESERRAAERLQGALNVRPVRDTYLITVSLESSTAQGLAELVNAIIETYLEKIRDADLYASDVRIANLNERRETLLQEIEQNTRQRTALAQELGVTTFAESALNPYDKLLVDSNNALAEARRRRLATEAQLQSFSQQQKAGRAALNAAAQELVAKDAGLNSLKANLFERRSQVLEQLSGLGRKHPVREQAERELAEIDQELEQAGATLMTATRRMLLDLRRADVRQSEQVEEELQKQFNQQRDQAAWFAIRYNEALGLSDAILRARKQLEAIEDRIDFLALESRAPGFVRLETAAREPELPIKGGRKKLAVLFGVLGLGLGLAAPIAVDLLDRRIKLPEQVEKILGFRPLAALLEINQDSDVRRVAADQLRRLALALERERSVSGANCIALTSAGSGAGVTWLTLGLAREFEQNGIRAIAVEANPLQPDARYHGNDPTTGLASVLSGELPLAAALVRASDTLP